MYCIETQNLSYHFSQEQQVLNKVNLQVPTGSIYGFLGPNGAGKTTTLRLILGLLRKQAGTISIFGKPFLENRIPILKNIGSLIESPSLYGHLTALENLRIQQVLYQCPQSRILEVLNTVGLSDTGQKKAGQFSLGMKQRLSIAVALLHNPSLLILDEPTNGLDPNGIIEIRDLLKKINREYNITILISSHLLSEIEKLVTHIGIINKGNILFQGKLTELQTKQNLGASIQIKTNNNIAAVNILAAAGFQAVLEHEKVILPKIEEAQIAALNKQLVQQNIDVFQISHHQNDLESIFIDLINL
jgi:ABC-2 type transport system ATP-binding protein